MNTTAKAKQLQERLRDIRGERLAVNGPGDSRPEMLLSILSARPGKFHLIEPLFPPGELGITPAADEAVTLAECLECLGRHLTGDWGELDRFDADENWRALEEGRRILSCYRTGNGTRFYIITEADRTRTTILLPEDY
jgi:hypothetical protein